mgnify:CR=1 FL=1
MDFETFGEQHWPDTGIHNFLTDLLHEILVHRHLDMATPSEVIKRYEPVGSVDVPELGTVSWSGLERDTSCWLGNTMQWAYYKTVRDLEPLVKESGDPDLIRTWRYLQISDHTYYMFTSGGEVGEVHSYFSPYKNPVDAFVTCQGVLTDFEVRLRLFTVAAKEPFRFYTGVGKSGYTGVDAWSLKGFIKSLSRVDVRSIEFHNRRSDFESWARFSLRSPGLAEELRRIAASGLPGEGLRSAIVGAAKRKLDELSRRGEDLGFY